MEHYINNLEEPGSYIDRLNHKRLKAFVMEPDGTVGIDHADSIKTADYFIGSWLTAKKPGVVLSSPQGTAKSAFNTGDIVGRIFSYVQDNHKVYWQLEDKQGGPNGGFVIHEPGRYDTKVALETSSGKELEDVKAAQKAIEDDQIINKLGKTGTALLDGTTSIVKGAGDALSGIGKTLPLIVGVIVIAVLYIAFTKAKAI